jgi:hypothetical protein
MVAPVTRMFPIMRSRRTCIDCLHKKQKWLPYFCLPETPFGNLDHTFRYFKELILCHAVSVSEAELLPVLACTHVTGWPHTYLGRQLFPLRYFPSRKVSWVLLLLCLGLAVSNLRQIAGSPVPYKSGVIMGILP